jgi:hypothetical protein
MGMNAITELHGSGVRLCEPLTRSGLGRPDAMETTVEEVTITVPEAGKRYFGLSRNASYDAAKRGEIPTVKIGKLYRVPVHLMEKMMGGRGKEDAPAENQEPLWRKAQKNEPLGRPSDEWKEAGKLKFRNGSLRKMIEASAAKNGCSISEEIEHRLFKTFWDDIGHF